jgi:hypothetical protein
MSPEEDDLADRAFEIRARAELRREVEATQRRLHAELDRIVDRALDPPPQRHPLRFALSAGAVAALAALLVLRPWHDTVAPDAPAADDLALLIDVDNLDLLEQMEFYQWLDRQPGMLDAALAASASAQRS